MWRTFANVDRPNKKIQSQKHIITSFEGLMPRSALATIILWSTIQKKRKNYFFSPKIIWIPNFSNNVETSGLWPHLDSKYFLSDLILRLSACYISILLSRHRSLYSCELSFELSKILNYCAEYLTRKRSCEHHTLRRCVFMPNLC